MKRYKKEIIAEFLLAATFIVALSILLIKEEFFEWWFDYTRAHDDWELDELFAIYTATVTVISILCFRYIRILRKVFAELEDAHKTLQQEQSRRIRQEKLSALGSMASGITHEVNNALQPTVGLGNFILKGLQDSGNHKHAEYMNTIMQSTAHAKKIIDQILEYAREEKHRENYKIQDAKELLNNSLEFSKKIVPAEVTINHIFSDDFINRSPRVFADKTKISQVFINLLKNAGESMNNNGVIDVVIDSTTCPESSVKGIKISITDRGMGMDKNTLARIFDPFFTTKDISEGTGLGLAAVQNIIDKHFGMIQVTSEVGQGTTFTIYLPEYKQRQENTNA